MAHSHFILTEFLRLANRGQVTHFLRNLHSAFPESLLRSYQTAPRCALLPEVHQLWSTLNRRQQREGEEVCHTIHRFSNREGFNALKAAGEILRLEGDSSVNWDNWDILIRSRRTFRDKAFGAYLFFTPIFRRAEPLLELSPHSGARSVSYAPAAEPDLSSETLSQLERALEEFLLAEQGRGGVCTIEPICSPDWIFLAVRPDDYPSVSLCHDEERRLRRSFSRGTYQMIFAIDLKRGRTYLDTRGSDRFQESLHQLFYQYLYRTAPDPLQPKRNLDLFLEDDFSFDPLPEDHVQITVRSLRLELFGSTVRIHLAAAPDTPISAALSELRRTPASLRQIGHITRAEIAFHFLPIAGGSERTYTITLTSDGNFLLYGIEREHAAIIEKYLSMKGLLSHDNTPLNPSRALDCAVFPPPSDPICSERFPTLMVGPYSFG